jgi:hypothetical protein
MTPLKSGRKPASVSEKKRRWVVISDESDASDQEENEDEEPASPYRVTSIFSTFLRGKAAPAAAAAATTTASVPPQPTVAATKEVVEKRAATEDKSREPVVVLDLMTDESEDCRLLTRPLSGQKRRRKSDDGEEPGPEDYCLSMELFSLPHEQPAAEEVAADEPAPVVESKTARSSPHKQSGAPREETSQLPDEPFASFDPLADLLAPSTAATSKAETQGQSRSNSSSSNNDGSGRKNLSSRSLEQDEDASFDPLGFGGASMPLDGTHIYRAPQPRLMLCT